MSNPPPTKRPTTDSRPKVSVPAWIFAETDRCNRFLLYITPEGKADVDGGHDDPADVAEAKHLFERIALLRKPEGTRWVMVTIEEVPEFTGRVNESALATLNRL